MDTAIDYNEIIYIHHKMHHKNALECKKLKFTHYLYVIFVKII